MRGLEIMDRGKRLLRVLGNTLENLQLTTI